MGSSRRKKQPRAPHLSTLVDARERWITLCGEMTPEAVASACDLIATEVGKTPDEKWTVDCTIARSTDGALELVLAVHAALSERGTLAVVGASPQLNALVARTRP